MANARILIVDDNLNQCKTMAFILEHKGFTVFTADEGFKAIELVREATFDIIFMDIKMPLMDGVETFRQVKAIRPETVVIMMTAYALEELIAEALEEGAFGIIYKPVDIEKVLQLIEEARKEKTGGLIMIVDDDPDACKTFKAILERKGYHVQAANNGEEAIAMAKMVGQDIFFIDLNLPTINGLETYLEIKKDAPDAVAVIMTGYPREMNELVTLAIQNNAYTCIYKPLDMEQILLIINEILEKRQ